ncbi:DUF1566 domain-containing protein [Stenotrophomonas sp. 278]|uniref:Lcl C-terminal domain-containing protein n=1 Tax=Stenotrophomonas sp. 278 TaxID=2479851 RepID=UPI001C8C370B|nr:DUF1566 domain-containing protein [Stenotrophomonas sp. 278]
MTQQSQQRFTQTHGGVLTVIDASTGLEWIAKPLSEKKSHQGAIDACDALDFAGHTDWRLPTTKELYSLVDLSRIEPAIDTAAFPDFPKSGWFWTSDLYAGVASCAWDVYFGNGGVNYYHRNNYGFVLAVRRASQ